MNMVETKVSKKEETKTDMGAEKAVHSIYY